MNSVFLIGIGASIFTAFATLPQLIKIIREKKANDISLMMLLILLSGLILWIWYGYKKMDWIIILSNSFSCLVNLLIVIFSLKYKNK